MGEGQFPTKDCDSSRCSAQIYVYPDADDLQAYEGRCKGTTTSFATAESGGWRQWLKQVSGATGHKPLEARMKRRHFKDAAIPALFMLTQKSVYISEVLTRHTSEAFFPKQAPEHEASAAEKC